MRQPLLPDFNSLTRLPLLLTPQMENRSFDHMLGHLAQSDPRIDGPPAGASNPVNPSSPTSPTVPAANDAIDGGPYDPPHDFDSITRQVFGFDKEMNATAAVTMDGFVYAADVAHGTGIDNTFVMSLHNSTNLPILSTLATEFAVFDHWHCSCPCPTNPNREFMMSGTSHGMIENTLPTEGFPQRTHFKFLEERNFSWSIYYGDDPWMAPAFVDLRTPSSLARIQQMPAFYAALSNGTLANYTLIQPRMSTSKDGISNWQHPDNSVAAGEALIASIYTALRNSTYWDETLFLITYDEHGGFYDHQPPAQTGVPAPDSIIGENGFKFDRLGVRIPTVAVSPLIAKGTVVNAPTPAQGGPTSQFDATSIIATANKIFGISEHMTARDEWAATFTDILGTVPRALADTPDLPVVPPLSDAAIEAEASILLNDHHLDSLDLLCALVPAPAHEVHAACAETPRDGAVHAHLAESAFGLRQMHFADASAALWKAYTASVISKSSS